ncbi:hypothetical protein [Paraprevotella clara]|jgi:uncharacterized protein YqgC (DUF456 family)|uniref:hypothetical protein n=1 Tax=Paraprevotella clara TaxID=454154 RepID=UPI004025196D
MMANEINDVVTQFVHEHMYMHIVLIALSVAVMLLSMAVDFFTGLQKARRNGVARTSQGLKKTAAKATKYFTPYMVLVGIDLISCVVLPVPAFSMVWAAYCVYCEFKSVREKSWQKAEIQKAGKTMSVIIENKDDIARLAAEILFNKEKAEKEAKDEKR